MPQGYDDQFLDFKKRVFLSHKDALKNSPDFGGSDVKDKAGLINKNGGRISLKEL